MIVDPCKEIIFSNHINLFKSVSLLPNVLGKQAARTAGAQEAWQYDENGFITEGTSTNAWILDNNDNLIIDMNTIIDIGVFVVL